MALSLTFDDGRPSQLDQGIPILNRYSVPATFYVNPGRIELRLGDWKAALEQGHEIGNHSLNHPCTGNFDWSRLHALEDYTLARMQKELEDSEREIHRQLGIWPRTFAYPCGQTFVGRGEQLQSYVPLVAKRYLSGRGWLDESSNNPWICDLAQLLGMELDGLENTQVRALISEAKSRRAWLVLCGHDIGEGGRQTTLVSTLEKICVLAKDPDQGIWVDTIANVAEHVQKVRSR
jgi:peptidoglycan/xylan/chitin deacetylase (PgdA/CDA1 family)